MSWWPSTKKVSNFSIFGPPVTKGWSDLEDIISNYTNYFEDIILNWISTCSWDIVWILKSSITFLTTSSIRWGLVSLCREVLWDHVVILNFLKYYNEYKSYLIYYNEYKSYLSHKKKQEKTNSWRWGKYSCVTNKRARFTYLRWT